LTALGGPMAFGGLTDGETPLRRLIRGVSALRGWALDLRGYDKSVTARCLRGFGNEQAKDPYRRGNSRALRMNYDVIGDIHA
jgi:hypothetical protein